MQKKSCLPEDVTLGSLFITLMLSAFIVVLPSIVALQSLPGHYANALPAGNTTMLDADRDGIGDYLDAYPVRYEA